MQAEKLTEHLECTYCLGFYQDPRNLFCGHTFCLVCLEKDWQGTTEIKCIICRQISLIPDGGIKGFSKNFVADGAVASLSNDSRNSPLPEQGDETIARTLLLYLLHPFVNILSLSSDKLLVGNFGRNVLSIFGVDGSYQRKLVFDDGLRDAVWTKSNDIVISTLSNNLLIVSDKGRCVKLHEYVANPQRLSISQDETIYVADGEDGVFALKPNGKRFEHIFRTHGGSTCVQAIAVKNLYNYWTIECFLKKKTAQFILRRYCVKNRKSCIKWINLVVEDLNLCSCTQWPELVIENVKFCSNSRLNSHVNSSIICSYSMASDKKFVYLSDKYAASIRIFTQSGQFLRILLSKADKLYFPCRIAVDNKRRLLYVGQNGTVKVYSLENCLSKGPNNKDDRSQLFTSWNEFSNPTTIKFWNSSNLTITHLNSYSTQNYTRNNLIMLKPLSDIIGVKKTICAKTCCLEPDKSTFPITFMTERSICEVFFSLLGDVIVAIVIFAYVLVLFLCKFLKACISVPAIAIISFNLIIFTMLFIPYFTIRLVV